MHTTTCSRAHTYYVARIVHEYTGKRKCTRKHVLSATAHLNGRDPSKNTRPSSNTPQAHVPNVTHFQNPLSDTAIAGHGVWFPIHFCLYIAAFSFCSASVRAGGQTRRLPDMAFGFKFIFVCTFFISLDVTFVLVSRVA